MSIIFLRETLKTKHTDLRLLYHRNSYASDLVRAYFIVIFAYVKKCKSLRFKFSMLQMKEILPFLHGRHSRRLGPKA